MAKSYPHENEIQWLLDEVSSAYKSCHPSDEENLSDWSEESDGNAIEMNEECVIDTGYDDDGKNYVLAERDAG